MSIKLMSQVWEKELNHSEQAILLAMADFADDDGRNCYPSYKRLAWKTGYSERQVARIIKGLCAQGILSIARESTQHQSTHYWIRLDKARNKEPFRVDTMSTLEESRVDICDIQGRQMEHPGWTSATSRVDTMSTDPLIEPPIEPSLDPFPLPAAKPPTPQQEMFEAICEAIGWDYRTLSEKDKGQVAQAMGILRKANYTLDDIRRFMAEVWFRDWRWEKHGQRPTLAQLRQEIGKLRAGIPVELPPAQTKSMASYTRLGNMLRGGTPQ